VSPTQVIPTPASSPGAPTLWLTGLSGAGKTTIARAVAERLAAHGIASYVLDGDELRAGLSADLGFSVADRAEQVRRAGHVARILGDAGVIVLASLISPTRAERDALRASHPAGRFFEIHVATTLEVCESRDVKGLYARARAGQIPDFTGIDAPYEPPLAPELTLDGAGDLDAAVEMVCSLIGFGQDSVGAHPPGPGRH
jgi:adenylyl-sulfate kinase